MTQSDGILNRLLALHPKAIDFSLERILQLLSDLGHPELHLPPVIHIAGTNGKGSTAAMLRAGLEAAGLRVHAYHSPHLVRFHERITLTGRRIREPELARVLDHCEQVNRGRPITFFEITTAAAFLAFSERKADYTILEVGLGGRLDATNVVSKPALCVITRIGLDHQQYLGDSLTTIAGEKAGILKPGVPVVVGTQRPVALAEIGRIAGELGARPFREGQEWSCSLQERGMVYEDSQGRLVLPRPGLAGDHQVENAGIAVASLRLLGASHAARFAVQTRNWPARLQRIRSGPLLNALPEDTELVLDGGHNEDAGRVLARELEQRTRQDGRPPFLITGMLATKDARAFYSAFAGIARHAFAVPITSSEAGISPDTLADIVTQAGVNCEPCKSPLDAARRVRHESAERPRVLICGSLYLAGELLRDHR